MKFQGVGKHLGRLQERVPCALVLGCSWRGARTLLLCHLSSGEALSLHAAPALPLSVCLHC